MEFLRSVFESTAVKVIALLVAPVIAAWIIRLREKQSKWAGPIIYGLGAYALIMFGLVAVKLWLAPASPEQITPENVESHIRDWVDSLGLGLQRQTDNGVRFEFVISLSSGNHVIVYRPVARDQYLMFRGDVTVSGEHTEIIEGLTDEQNQRLNDEVTLELSRAKFGYVIIPTDSHSRHSGRLSGIGIVKAMAITSTFNRDTLASALDEIDAGVLLGKATIRLALNSRSEGQRVQLR